MTKNCSENLTKINVENVCSDYLIPRPLFAAWLGSCFCLIDWLVDWRGESPTNISWHVVIFIIQKKRRKKYPSLMHHFQIALATLNNINRHVKRRRKRGEWKNQNYPSLKHNFPINGSAHLGNIILFVFTFSSAAPICLEGH